LATSVLLKYCQITSLAITIILSWGRRIWEVMSGSEEQPRVWANLSPRERDIVRPSWRQMGVLCSASGEWSFVSCLTLNRLIFFLSSREIRMALEVPTLVVKSLLPESKTEQRAQPEYSLFIALLLQRNSWISLQICFMTVSTNPESWANPSSSSYSSYTLNYTNKGYFFLI